MYFVVSEDWIMDRVHLGLLIRFFRLSKVRLSWPLSELHAVYGLSVSQIVLMCRYLEKWGVVCELDESLDTLRFPYVMCFLSKDCLVDAVDDMDVEVFSAIPSTNDYCMAYAGATDKPKLVLAEYQSGGKGQYGRCWDAAFASNILMSYCVHSQYRCDWSGFSWDLGRKICAKLNGLFDKHTFVCKYPNDILCGGRKLAGILVESRMQGDSQKVVVGLGVNVYSPYAYNLTEDRVSLYQLTRTYHDRTALVVQLLEVISGLVDSRLKD